MARHGCPERLTNVSRSGKWPWLVVTRLPQSALHVPLYPWGAGPETLDPPCPGWAGGLRRPKVGVIGLRGRLSDIGDVVRSRMSELEFERDQLDSCVLSGQS